MKGIIGACTKQSRIPTSKTRKAQYAAFADVIISMNHGDFDAAISFLDSVGSVVEVARSARQQKEQADAKFKLQGSFGGILSRKATGHTMCNHCWKWVHKSKYHDWRNCPERVVCIGHEKLLELSLRLNWARSSRTLVRLTLGNHCATEKDFLVAREELRRSLPPTRLCADKISVTTDPVAALEYAFKLAHVDGLLPKAGERCVCVCVCVCVCYCLCYCVCVTV